MVLMCPLVHAKKWIISALEEEAKAMLKQRESELKQFWKNILLILRSVPDGSKLHDVACLEYVVKEDLIPDNNLDNESKVRTGFECVCAIHQVIYFFPTLYCINYAAFSQNLKHKILFKCMYRHYLVKVMYLDTSEIELQINCNLKKKYSIEKKFCAVIISVPVII